MTSATLSRPGTLIHARGREWVVLPQSTEELLMARPLGGHDEEITGLLPAVETVRSASFPLPCEEDIGDFASGKLLRDAARLSTRAAAGPFRSFARIAAEPRLYQHALRDVIGHCLDGVDINPMAVELCRVSLWLEAMEPGKPLSFLDHHLQCGNSLLGTTAELIAQGIPDDAFKPIEGDDRKACAELKKRNKAEGKEIGGLFVAEDVANTQALRSAALAVDEMPDETPEAVQRKADAFATAQTRYDYLKAKRLADAWCAAFVIHKRFPPSPMDPRFPSTEPFGITQGHIMDLAQGRSLPAELAGEVERLADPYQFFHWRLAFPEVFSTGGFDCVLGNPPWERVKLQEKEWFAQRSPEIANAPNAAARKRLIADLANSQPELLAAFAKSQRKAEGESHLLRNSGRYPLCGRGDINVYTVFAESMRGLLADAGRAGIIVPSGIATDDTTKFFFQNLMDSGNLASLFDFENKGIFPGVHSSYKFCLLTLRGADRQTAGGPTARAEFAFFIHTIEDLRAPDRRFTLSAADIALLNPNTRTCPIFRTRADAELTKGIYRRVPVLIREAQGDCPEHNPWSIRFSTMFHMSNDSHLFRTREQLEADGWTLEGNVFRKQEQTANGEERGEEYLPLYEAKMVHHFDHRWATYDGLDTRELTLAEKQDPRHVACGRYWVSVADVRAALANTGWQHQWLLGWRDICRSTDERTVIGGLFGLSAVGNNLPVWTPSSSLGAPTSGLFLASLASFATDFSSRFKVGGTHLNFFIAQQLPVLPPAVYTRPCPWSAIIPPSPFSIRDFLLPRVLELTYTAWDLEPFARDGGYDGPPFRWDEERRFLLRCELDAAFFHLYLPAATNGDWKTARKAEGYAYDETPEQLAELKKHFPTPRDAAAYIMDTFPIVKRKDEAAHGVYRTRDTILAIYDEMAEAMKAGHPYQTRLDPPPGPPCDANGKLVPMAQWNPEEWPSHIHLPEESAGGR